MKNYDSGQRNDIVQFVIRSLILSSIEIITMHQFYPKVISDREGMFAIVLTTVHEEAQLLKQS